MRCARRGHCARTPCSRTAKLPRAVRDVGPAAHAALRYAFVLVTLAFLLTSTTAPARARPRPLTIPELAQLDADAAAGFSYFSTESAVANESAGPLGADMAAANATAPARASRVRRSIGDSASTRAHAFSHATVEHRIGETTVLRRTLLINGVRVAGADAVVARHRLSRRHVDGDTIDALFPSGPLAHTHAAGSDAQADAPLPGSTAGVGSEPDSADPRAHPCDGDALPEFVLSHEDAVVRAAQAGFVGHTAVQIAGGLGDPRVHVERVYLYAGDGVGVVTSSPACPLVPAYRVFDASRPVHLRRTVTVDGRSGAVILVSQGARHAQARLFTSAYEIHGQPRVVDIPALNASSTNGGRGIVGGGFKAYSACLAFKCLPDAGTNSTVCDEDATVCVGDKEARSDPAALRASVPFTVDPRELDASRDWDSLGYKDNRMYFKWRGAPVVAPRLALALEDNGIWGSRLDTADAPFDFENPYSELQTWYYLYKHLEFLKNLVQDPSFCLVGAPGPPTPGNPLTQCSGVDPRTNRSGTRWEDPFKIIANYRYIDPYTQLDPAIPLLGDQIEQNRGKSPDTPIILTGVSDFPEAFFSDGNFIPPANNSEFRTCGVPTLTDNATLLGICTAAVNLPYPFIAFGKSKTEGDWGLNICIAFHELTHALVAKYVPELGSYTYDSLKNMTSADPGALNEGWADYFAYIHCNVSNFNDQTYNNRPRRSINNDRTCVNVEGQVHRDSLHFSGALQRLRTLIPSTPGLSSDNQVDFDRVVLAALAQAQRGETIARQFTRILRLLESSSSLLPLVNLAKAEFNRRELNCVRSRILDEADSASPVLPSVLATLKGASTTAAQYVAVPAISDWAIELRWFQYSPSDVFGALTTGWASRNLWVMISWDCALAFADAANATESTSNSSNENFAVHRPPAIAGAQACGSANSPLQWRAPARMSGRRGFWSLRIPRSSLPLADKYYFVLANTAPAFINIDSLIVRYEGFGSVALTMGTVIGGIGVVVIGAFLIAVAMRAVTKIHRQLKPAAGPAAVVTAASSSVGVREASGELSSAQTFVSHADSGQTSNRCLCCMCGLTGIALSSYILAFFAHAGMLALGLVADEFNVVRVYARTAIPLLYVPVIVLEAVHLHALLAENLILSAAGTEYANRIFFRRRRETKPRSLSTGATGEAGSEDNGVHANTDRAGKAEAAPRPARRDTWFVFFSRVSFVLVPAMAIVMATVPLSKNVPYAAWCVVLSLWCASLVLFWVCAVWRGWVWWNRTRHVTNGDDSAVHRGDTDGTGAASCDQKQASRSSNAGSSSKRCSGSPGSRLEDDGAFDGCVTPMTSPDTKL